MQVDAIIVCGAESSGNRLVCRTLAANGFVNVTETRRWQDVLTPTSNDPIVWLRSVPHAREWPDLVGMAQLLVERGYRPAALIPTRDWACTAASQVRAGHVDCEVNAHRHLRIAAATTCAKLSAASVPFAFVSYEHLVKRPDYTLRGALRLVGVDTPPLTIHDEIRDENTKYVERDPCCPAFVPSGEAACDLTRP